MNIKIFNNVSGDIEIKSKGNTKKDWTFTWDTALMRINDTARQKFNTGEEERTKNYMDYGGAASWS